MAAVEQEDACRCSIRQGAFTAMARTLAAGKGALTMRKMEALVLCIYKVPVPRTGTCGLIIEDAHRRYSSVLFYFVLCTRSAVWFFVILLFCS